MASEDNFKRNLKDEKEFLQIQRDIKERFEEQVGSLRDYAEWQKKVGQVWKELKTMQKEINRLEKEGTVEAQKKAEELKKEYNQLLAINKQLVKQGSILKATANIIDKQWGGVLGNILNKWFDFDEAVRKTGISMGLSASRMGQMQGNIIKASMYAQSWGVSAQELAEAQGAYSDEVGRAVLLTEDAYNAMARVGVQTGLGAQGVASMAAQMDQFGLGAEKSVGMIAELSSGAEAMGVNSGKVLKKFEQNMGLLNKLNFKNGVKGMMEMAKFSEKYKIDMNAVAGVADKVFRPEGAIEAAAQLQVLGGDLAALGDPFQLMYKARNSPEELAKSLTNAASASAKFNDKTGEFEVSAYELDRLREAANALGMDYNNLVETAKQGAKIKKFEGMLSGKGFSPEEMEMLTGIADAEGKVDLGFGPDGKKQVKLLSQLSKDEVKNLTDKRNLDDENQRNALSIRQEWQNTMNQLAMVTWPLLKAVQDFVKPFLDKLVPKITELFKWLSEWKKTIGILLIAVTGLWAITKITKGITAIKDTFGAIFGKGKNFKQGYEMGQGFNAATKSSVSGGAKGFLKGQKPLPAAPPTPPGGGGVPGGGGTNPGGMTKGINATDMIKGAAAILILSAALYVFAKSLLEFDKLQNGWESLAIAAVGLIVLGGALFLISKIPTDGVIKGAIAVAVLGVAMIPLAYAMSLMQGVDWAVLLVAAGAIIGFAFAAMALGPIVMTPIFWLGLLGLAAASVVLSASLWILSFGLEAVAPSMKMFMDSITSLPGVILPLMMLGPALMLTAAGIGVLALSLFGLGAAWFVGGSAFTEMTESLSAVSSINSSGLKSTIEAINSVDTDKLEALKELSGWLSILGATTTIKFDESLTIDGSIQLTGQSGGKTNTDWIKDPIFVSHLKEMIADATKSDERGGKA